MKKRDLVAANKHPAIEISLPDTMKLPRMENSLEANPFIDTCHDLREWIGEWLVRNYAIADLQFDWRTCSIQLHRRSKQSRDAPKISIHQSFALPGHPASDDTAAKLATCWTPKSQMDIDYGFREPTQDRRRKLLGDKVFGGPLLGSLGMAEPDPSLAANLYGCWMVHFPEMNGLPGIARKVSGT